MAEDAARNAARVVLEPSVLSKDSAQSLIEGKWSFNLTNDFLATIRERVEMVSTMFTRNVSGINRNQTPQEALDATGRKQYTTKSVVDAMPRGEREKVEMWFFELDYNPTPKDLAAEYELRDLKADPIGLASVLEVEPAFADDRPVACQWDLDENGKASYAVFYRWLDGRNVNVQRHGNRWTRSCRFAGVCK